MASLRSVKDATENLQKQFDAHRCAASAHVEAV
jgi:hypothetical protein